jgi:putative phosphoribosyl transferase
MVRRRKLAGRYANRTVAGRALGEALLERATVQKPIVLALPRGGVPVAVEVAARLGAALGVILVRKIGVPGRSELAMGALAMVGGQLSEFRNEEIVDGLGIPEQAFEAARSREQLELQRRGSVFPPDDLDVADATVILVDDGLATGSTMLAAVAAVRGLSPAAVVVAVPVGARQAVQALGAVADLVVCLSSPEPFIAVGGAYEDFRQLSDEEVVAILSEFAN